MELNSQININEIALNPKKIISIAKQEASDSFFANDADAGRGDSWRYKELFACADIVSKIITYIVYINNNEICNTDSLLEAVIVYNKAK